MVMLNYESILERFNWRNTVPRKLIITTLMQSTTPLTTSELCSKVQSADSSINTTTVYRVLQKLQEVGLVHTHANGGVSMCTLADQAGHHVLLQCNKCGTVQECSDTTICKQEAQIAKKYGFTHLQHVTELVGLCARCS